MATHGGAATVADLLTGTQSIYPEFIDPVVDEEVSALETASKTFQKAFQLGQWQESHAALLEVCRYGQRIRLEIGKLNLLDRTSRARTADALQCVVELLVNAPKEASANSVANALDKNEFEQRIAPYVDRFIGDQQRWARRAAINILERLADAEERATAGSGESSVPSAPK